MSKPTSVPKVEDKTAATSTAATSTTGEAPRVRLGDALTPWAKAPKARLGDALMPW